ncbi:MAG: hypothetical protein JOZ15_20840 [Acidobacteria bacterium]|nr:hypothetical protein [Acidobacteriota bacterium]
MSPQAPARPAPTAGLLAARPATRASRPAAFAALPSRLAAVAAPAAFAARPFRLAAQATFAAPAAFASLAVLAVLAFSAAPAAATPYDPGERLQFTGVVTDPAGNPVPGAQVVLEAARVAFRLRDMRRAERDARRVGATTNAQGEYAIEWPWDGYFNHFELLAGAVVRHGKEERLEVLEREDVSERVLAGSPIVSPIVLHNRALVDHLREFLASVRSADERRVYEEMGTPDDVKRVTYAGGQQPDAEVSWWYFAAGKVYRFRAGRLDQVERFDPVQRF